MAREVESATEVLNTVIDTDNRYCIYSIDSITTLLAVLLVTIVSVNTHSSQNF